MEQLMALLLIQISELSGRCCSLLPPLPCSISLLLQLGELWGMLGLSSVGAELGKIPKIPF